MTASVLSPPRGTARCWPADARATMSHACPCWESRHKRHLAARHASIALDALRLMTDACAGWHAERTWKRATRRAGHAPRACEAMRRRATAMRPRTAQASRCSASKVVTAPAHAHRYDKRSDTPRRSPTPMAVDAAPRHHHVSSGAQAQAVHRRGKRASRAPERAASQRRGRAQQPDSMHTAASTGDDAVCAVRRQLPAWHRRLARILTACLRMTRGVAASNRT